MFDDKLENTKRRCCLNKKTSNKNELSERNVKTLHHLKVTTK